MNSILLRKLPQFVLTLAGVAVLIFLLLRVIPGDVVAVFVKEKGGVPESFTRYVQNKIRTHFGFSGSPVRIVYKEK